MENELHTRKLFVNKKKSRGPTAVSNNPRDAFLLTLAQKATFSLLQQAFATLA
jgi:hypothetical protein